MSAGKEVKKTQYRARGAAENSGTLLTRKAASAKSNTKRPQQSNAGKEQHTAHAGNFPQAARESGVEQGFAQQTRDCLWYLVAICAKLRETELLRAG